MVFILIMGISASVSMAVYAFGTSSGIVKQIVATGLAREGIEAVRNMRDTNWLQDTLSLQGCYDYVKGANKADCYLSWLNKMYCIRPTQNNGNCNGVGASTKAYYLGFDSTARNAWFLSKDDNNFGLNFDANNSSGSGFYSPSASGVACNSTAGRADFCRKIILTEDSSAPFNQDVGPLLKVQSQVWWIDKKCPRVADFASAPPACRVELDIYLTNWKNY